MGARGRRLPAAAPRPAPAGAPRPARLGRAACGRAAAAPRRRRTGCAAAAASSRSRCRARPRGCRRRSGSAAAAAAPGFAPARRNPRSSWGRRGRAGRRCADSSRWWRTSQATVSVSAASSPKRGHELQRDLARRARYGRRRGPWRCRAAAPRHRARGATRSGGTSAVDSGWSSASSPRSIAASRPIARIECSSTV